MKEYTLTPFQQQKNIQVTVPGSKSITNRALLLAALAKGTTTLQGVLFSDDSRVFMEALKSLGYTLSIQEEEKCVQITSPGEKIPLSQASVYVGSAGTAARFLTAMLALSGGQYEVTSSEQMKGRPMKPLLLALEQLGVEFEYREAPYHFPFYIKGRQEKEVERVDLNIDESSQFLSALLLAGVMCRDGLEIHLTGQRDARSYVEISMKMMKEFGCSMEQVEKDIQELRRECRENREMLHNKMKYSKAKLVGRIAEAYDKVDQVIQIAQEQLGISFTEETTKELSAENKILLAEYFLDFAMQASNYALLMSLEAIHAQNDQPTQNP